VAERLNAAVLKTVDGGNVVRGFESPPFRSVMCRDIGDRCPADSDRMVVATRFEGQLGIS
jgi:hypothetical protein